MTRVTIVGQEYKKAEELLGHHPESFRVVDKNPDMVISYGGDGTLMYAEYLYPGVPKLYLKNSQRGKLAHNKENEVILADIAEHRYHIEKHMKLDLQIKKEVRTALNDVVVHNKNPQHALRYTITIDNKPIGEEIIGDGVVVATPLGATGYYRSITDSYFESGIGLAFNNSIEQSDHIVLRENRVVKLTIVRGPGICYADNQESLIEIHKGDTVTIQKSSSVAKIVVPTR